METFLSSAETISAMRTLSLEPKVISLANTLGIEGTDPVAAIRDYCAQRVSSFIRAIGSVTDIGELEKVVCEKLNLRVHEIWSDSELEQITQSYVADGEPVFAFLPADLDAGTYGVLVRLNKRIGKKFAWAALVDCRGGKHHRRFFTTWHEIVHCITAADQYELPFHRTIIGNKFTDPVERLVDFIAGDLAFFDPLFRPHLERELLSDGCLTFAAIDRIRDNFCPAASFEATLNACVTRVSSPLIFLKAGMILKEAEQALADSPQSLLFAETSPQAHLRVISTITNDGARRLRVHIPRHFRVPDLSVIALAYTSESIQPLDCMMPEDLSDWRCSDGTGLAPFKVSVSARRCGDQVFALIAPVVHL
jgi:hypothetical protein